MPSTQLRQAQASGVLCQSSLASFLPLSGWAVLVLCCSVAGWPHLWLALISSHFCRAEPRHGPVGP